MAIELSSESWRVIQRYGSRTCIRSQIPQPSIYEKSLSIHLVTSLGSSPQGWAVEVQGASNLLAMFSVLGRHRFVMLRMLRDGTVPKESRQTSWIPWIMDSMASIDLLHQILHRRIWFADLMLLTSYALILWMLLMVSMVWCHHVFSFCRIPGSRTTPPRLITGG